VPPPRIAPGTARSPALGFYELGMVNDKRLTGWGPVTAFGGRRADLTLVHP